MTTGHASMKRWRSSAGRSCDKLVIKQCFRGPRPSTATRGGGAIFAAGHWPDRRSRRATSAKLICKGTIWSCAPSNMRHRQELNAVTLYLGHLFLTLVESRDLSDSPV